MLFGLSCLEVKSQWLCTFAEKEKKILAWFFRSILSFCVGSQILVFCNQLLDQDATQQALKNHFIKIINYTCCHLVACLHFWETIFFKLKIKIKLLSSLLGKIFEIDKVNTYHELSSVKEMYFCNLNMLLEFLFNAKPENHPKNFSVISNQML